jgi:hypothetical protein
MWSEFKSNDTDGMIDQLVRYKNQHHQDDQRRILLCGIPDGKVRVEWVPPAAPGVDSKWEMQLFGLVRTGEREKAIQFVQETSGMSASQAAEIAAMAASNLGLTPWKRVRRKPKR